MLCLWNIIIENQEGKVALTPYRSRYLTTAFKQFFESDLTSWENYCLKIASSKFLMGEVTPFKASLDWVLKFNVMQKIIEGAYTFGDRVVTYPKSKEEERAAPLSSNALSTINESAESLIVREQIKSRITEGEYISWFKAATIKVDQGKTYLYVSTTFMKEIIRTRYSVLVESLFDALLVGEEDQICVSEDHVNLNQPSVLIEKLSVLDTQNLEKVATQQLPLEYNSIDTFIDVADKEEPTSLNFTNVVEEENTVTAYDRTQITRTPLIFAQALIKWLINKLSSCYQKPNLSLKSYKTFQFYQNNYCNNLFHAKFLLFGHNYLDSMTLSQRLC